MILASSTDKQYPQTYLLRHEPSRLEKIIGRYAGFYGDVDPDDFRPVTLNFHTFCFRERQPPSKPIVPSES